MWLLERSTELILLRPVFISGGAKQRFEFLAIEMMSFYEIFKRRAMVAQLGIDQADQQIWIDVTGILEIHVWQRTVENC